MLFDERTARYFLKIMEKRNITAAAAALYISQPSLSKFLAELEKENGVRLFDRNRGVLTPTPQCEKYAAYVKAAMRLNEKYRKELTSTDPEEIRRIRIGAGGITSPYLTRKVFPVFHREYPDIRLLLREDIHNNLLEAFAAGELDLMMLVHTGELVSKRGVFYTPLIRQQRIIALSPMNPLAAIIKDPSRNSAKDPLFISPELLNGQTLIMGITGQKINTDLLSFQRKYDLKFSDIITSQNLRSCIALAASNNGIFVFPEFYFREDISEYNLLFLAVEDPLMTWNLTIHHRSTLSEPEKRFVALAKEVFHP